MNPAHAVVELTGREPGRQLYRMHDADNRGCFPILPGEKPEDWQKSGHGIFWTVNRFRDATRRIENLECIVSWAIDMDVGTKPDMLAKLRGSPLIPSMVIETKRGYQAYWNAKDARPEHWNAIVLERLVPFFAADPNARDIARILRVPGFLHLKDPADPFLVREVHRSPVTYSEAEMVEAFPAAHQQTVHDEARQQAKFSGSDDFWSRVYQLDSESALARLSGHEAVRGETYSFMPAGSRGNRNIFVNGKTSSCWIDKAGHIGSLSKGGPTIAQWLRWFGMSYGDAAKVIKQVFPELAGADSVPRMKVVHAEPQQADGPPDDVPDPTDEDAPAGVRARRKRGKPKGMPDVESTDRPMAPGGALSDIGLGERFAARFHDRARYVAGWGKWIIYSGGRWVIDEGEVKALGMAQIVAIAIYGEIEDAGAGHASRAEIAEFATRSESASALRRMLETARSMPGMTVGVAELDSNPMLLNCTNGTVDLTAGTMRQHDPADLLTKLVAVRYEPDAKAPRWERFLYEIMDGRGDLVAFLWRFIGYSLTGSTTEHALVLALGTGANGKSILAEVLMALLGDYAVVAPPGLFTVQKHAQHPTELAALHGARLVVSSESGEGARIDEEKLKRLTGSDTISCRRMNENFWKYKPTHKLLILTNHRPQIRDVGHGMRRRLNLLPFDVTFWREGVDEPGPPERRADPKLLETLTDELPGILAWAVRGAVAWKVERLGQPEAVTAATADYMHEQDSVGRWMDERCVMGGDFRTRFTHLYQDFKGWCEGSGEYCLPNKMFGPRLAAHGLREGSKFNGYPTWIGIRLLHTVTDGNRDDR